VDLILMPLVMLLLLAGAFVLFWVGFFIVRRLRLRVAFLISALVVIVIAAAVTSIGLGVGTRTPH
jgi:hypothetical protein